VQKKSFLLKERSCNKVIFLGHLVRNIPLNQICFNKEKIWHENVRELE